MTIAERHQAIWKQYEEEHEHLPASAKTVAQWAVERNLLELPSIEPLDLLSDQLARSLREETAIGDNGRAYRINHAVRYTRNGAQTTMWGILGFATPEHMEMSFTQRREQIIGDCHRLKMDVDAYNVISPEGEPFQLVLDFTDDVAEREMFPKL